MKAFERFISFTKIFAAKIRSYCKKRQKKEKINFIEKGSNMEKAGKKECYFEP